MSLLSPADFDRIKNLLLTRRVITEKECWEWQGALTSSGYGQIVTTGNVHHAVHRLSFEIFRQNEFKDYLLVLHSCNNKKCFNPAHLYQGDHSTNLNDAIKDGIQTYTPKTHCNSGHELSGDNEYIAPDGRRRCKLCRNEASDRHNKSKRGLITDKNKFFAELTEYLARKK